MNEWMIAVLGIGFNYNSLKAAKINSWDKKEIRFCVRLTNLWGQTGSQNEKKKHPTKIQVSSAIY